MDKEEVKVTKLVFGEEKKVIAYPSTPPSTSMDYRPKNVTDLLLDSIKKITECNTLPFKDIDDCTDVQG